MFHCLYAPSVAVVHMFELRQPVDDVSTVRLLPVRDVRLVLVVVSQNDCNISLDISVGFQYYLLISWCLLMDDIYSTGHVVGALFCLHEKYKVAGYRGICVLVSSFSGVWYRRMISFETSVENGVRWIIRVCHHHVFWIVYCLSREATCYHIKWSIW